MAARIVAIYLVCYAALMFATLGFFPTFAHPDGDEGTYLNYAEHPWTLIGDFFEGYPPKEVMNPFNLRLFLMPIAVVQAGDGFGYVAARSLSLVYAIGTLWFVFRIGQRLAGDAWAASSTVLLSCSPFFVDISHRVHPEVMMAFFVAACTWLLMRKPGEQVLSRDFAVGSLSMACIWIHYNGVFMPVAFLFVFIANRGRGLRRQQLFAFAAGVALVAVLYALVNLWPARQTLNTYGPAPVTFSSTNRLPLIDPIHLPGTIVQRVIYYFWELLIASHSAYETGPIVLLFLGMAALGVWSKGAWDDRTALAALVGMLTLILVLVPKARIEYLYYLYPLLFPLVAVGAQQLAKRRWRRIATIGFFVVAVCTFTVRDASEAVRWYAVRRTNNVAGASLARIVAETDSAPQVTVMACQEFFVYVPDSRFRTFHSIIETKDLAKTLALLDVDVVVLTPRAYRVMLWQTIQTPVRFPTDEVAIASAAAARSRLAAEGIVQVDQVTGKIRPDFEKWHAYLVHQLSDRGFTQVATEPLELNNEPVEIFVRQAAETVRRNETRSVTLVEPSSVEPIRQAAQ